MKAYALTFHIIATGPANPPPAPVHDSVSTVVPDLRVSPNPPFAEVLSDVEIILAVVTTFS